MRINYSLIGKDRKQLVAKIAELTGEKPIYMKLPTYAYKIGPFEVSKTGVLSCEEWADDTAKEIAGKLAEAGFEGKIEEPEESATTADTEPQEGSPEPEPEADLSEENTELEQPAEADPSEKTEPETVSEEQTSLSISLADDLTDRAFENLRRVIASKQTLMRHAFQSEVITVDRKDGQLVFSGFTASDGDHTDAYMRYITLLTKFAKEAKRVTGKDYPVDNEKFAFRCFLLRLGMIGADYKKTRKILLENLTGNSSWKNGAPEKAAPVEKAAKTSAESEVAANE